MATITKKQTNQWAEKVYQQRKKDDEVRTRPEPTPVSEDELTGLLSGLQESINDQR